MLTLRSVRLTGRSMTPMTLVFHRAKHCDVPKSLVAKRPPPVKTPRPTTPSSKQHLKQFKARRSYNLDTLRRRGRTEHCATRPVNRG